MNICIDIGGFTTRVGFSSSNINIDSIITFPTFDIFSSEINTIIQTIHQNTKSVHKICIGCAGSLDKKNGFIISWGQKKSWWNRSLFKPLHKAFPKAQLLLENDANLAALGEAIYGAGKNYNLVGYISLSSGIGGCLISNKSIVPHYFGIEPAHQIINYNEIKKWSCGQKGCFESYASGKAFQKIFGITPNNCDNKTIWKQYSSLVAVGIANMLVLWSPEVLVIGGGISNKFNQFHTPLIKKLKSLLPIFQIPPIIKANLNEPCLYGCLSYTV